MKARLTPLKLPDSAASATRVRLGAGTSELQDTAGKNVKWHDVRSDWLSARAERRQQRRDQFERWREELRGSTATLLSAGAIGAASLATLGHAPLIASDAATLTPRALSSVAAVDRGIELASPVHRLDAPGILQQTSMGAGFYARATPLKDGSLFGTREATVGDRQLLIGSRSVDGGRSWSDLGPIASESVANSRSLANTHAIELDDGTLLASYRNNVLGADGQTHYRLEVKASLDGGLTWSARAPLEDFSTKNGGAWEPFLFVTPGGKLQAYYALERDGGRSQDILVKDSANRGQTWSAPRVVASQDGSRDGMAGVTALDDGSLLAVFESHRDPSSNDLMIRAVQSNDEGGTWGKRHDVFMPDAGRLAGAPQVAKLPDGRLAVTFYSDAALPRPAGLDGSATLMALTNGPATFNDVKWGPPTTIAPAVSYYAGLVPGMPTANPIATYAMDGHVYIREVEVPPLAR